MTPPIASAATQTIATIAFGILATLISVFTVWQGHRVWRKFYGRSAEPDLESKPSEAVELEARQISEVPSVPLSSSQLSTATTSAVPKEERLLDPLAASAPTTAPPTTTTSPARAFSHGRRVTEILWVSHTDSGVDGVADESLGTSLSRYIYEVTQDRKDDQ